ncbi:MAG: hypothetical protein HY744_23610 [Deltaproteobacteria bacterium]|nr:hypothetical protein [Deltaproteobacteria bacterium]
MDQVSRQILVEQLAALPDAERHAVVCEANARARPSRAGSAGGPALPWAVLRCVIGIVHGGPADAVEDCHRLYDG